VTRVIDETFERVRSSLTPETRSETVCLEREPVWSVLIERAFLGRFVAVQPYMLV